jgi:hypothetical protein
MILKGRLAELMAQVASNLYKKYTSVDRKGTAIRYVKMQKAIYGFLRSALLFYKKLVADLESIGFKLNPYDPCVANKEVNETQMTVLGGPVQDFLPFFFLAGTIFFKASPNQNKNRQMSNKEEILFFARGQICPLRAILPAPFWRDHFLHY